MLIRDSIISETTPYAIADALGLGGAFAANLANRINYFLDQMASQIAARGAGGNVPAPRSILPIGSTPPVPTLPRAVRGWERELKVADITGGTVIGAPGGVGLEISTWLGTTDVDVVGPDGTFIAVGGPAKMNDLSGTAERLLRLQAAAREQGVRAEAWFTADTPRRVIEKAWSILGFENVHTF
jgi:hypothetical protein